MVDIVNQIYWDELFVSPAGILGLVVSPKARFLTTSWDRLRQEVITIPASTDPASTRMYMSGAPGGFSLCCRACHSHFLCDDLEAPR